MRIRVAVLAPARAFPLALAIGFASLVRAFALPSASSLGFEYTITPCQHTFRAEIMPGNAFARVRLSPGVPLDLVFLFFC